MRSRSTARSALALGAAALSWMLSGRQALAQPSGGEAHAAPPDEDEIQTDLGVKRPAGPDERTGHLLLQPRIGVDVPFGAIATGLSASRIVRGGLALGGDLGVGLSRSLVLEASGSYARLYRASSCIGCSGRSLDLGLGFVYHAAQGLAFDPWISFGVGYRRAVFSGATDTGVARFTLKDAVFHGLDIGRIALGGDFYPLPALGIGAFLEVDAGTYLARPDASFGASAYGFFQAGLRIAFDPVPRGRRAPAGAAAAVPTRFGSVAAAHATAEPP